MKKYSICILLLFAISPKNYGIVPSGITPAVQPLSAPKANPPATSLLTTGVNPPATSLLTTGVNPPATSLPTTGVNPPATSLLTTGVNLTGTTPNVNAPLPLPTTLPAFPAAITPVIPTTLPTLPAIPLPALPDVLATPSSPTTTPPASPGIVASASSAAYAAPTPLYCTNGKQMGLIAVKVNPISTTLPSAPKGIPMLESTAQNPAPQGQSTLNDAKTLCAAAGGPNMKKLKQELEKQKYDTSVLKKIK